MNEWESSGDQKVLIKSIIYFSFFQVAQFVLLEK